MDGVLSLSKREREREREEKRERQRGGEFYISNDWGSVEEENANFLFYLLEGCYIKIQATYCIYLFNS